jgi:hypothetical protein
LNYDQLLFLDPFGVDIALLNRSFSLGIIGQIDTFRFIVFFQGEFFRFRCFFFNWRVLFGCLISGLGGFCFLAFLGILISILLVLNVTDVAVSSSGFSGSVSEWIRVYRAPVPDCLSWT